MAHTKHLIQNMENNGLRSSFMHCYRPKFSNKKENFVDKTSEMVVILTTPAIFVTYIYKRQFHMVWN